MTFEYDKKMGRQIRKLREERKLPQEQLAILLQLQGCDITRSALAKIEYGARHIYSHEIKAFQEVLNVPFEELFVEKPEEPEPTEPEKSEELKEQ